MRAQITNFKLVVSDLDRSLAFYSVFGLKEAVRLEFADPDVTEALLEDATGTRGLVLLHGDVMPVPSASPGWAPLVVNVDDIDAARKEIRDAGFELAVEPLSLGAVNICMVADPDGYLVEIVSGNTDTLDGIPTGQKIPHPIPHIHQRGNTHTE